MSTDLLSLWGAIQRGDSREIASHLIPQLSTDAARKPYVISQGREDSPNAGLGSVETGPIARYWTVRYRHDGSPIWNYTHVIACDPFKASMVVGNRHRAVVEVLREIQRDEYEHLTRKSP